MGSKPTSSSNSTSSFSPPSWALSAYQNTIGQAQQVASQPYTPYNGQLVAPVNSQQTTGINAINSTSGVQNPYNSSATGLLNSGSSTINPGTVGASQIAQYESPYQSQVVNATEAEIQNQNQQQSASLAGNAISSGAFGGDRSGVAQAALAGQQDLANNATLANLNNQNYQQALSEANTQQQTGLQAQEQTAANQLTAGSSLGNLGNTAQTEALNEANAQTNAGTLQQQTSQASDTANYNQYLQQLSYPYQNLSWLSSIEGGLGSLAGGTTNSQSQQYSSNPLSSILGGAIGLGSLLIPGAQPLAAAAGAAAADNPYNVARGGRIKPRKASGGGLDLGGIGGTVSPYSQGNQEAPGAGSWVPGAVQISGHSTMPSAGGASMSGAAQQPNSLGNMQQTAQQVQGLGQGIEQGLGSLQTLGGSLNFAMQSPDQQLATFGGGDPVEGLVNMPYKHGGRTRRHFDSGGAITADGLLFDPAALNDNTSATPIPNVTTPATASAIPSYSSGASAIPISEGLGAASSGQDDGTFGRMINAESGGQQFDANGQPLTSPKGAAGIAQVMPGTAPEAAADAGLAFDPVKYQTDASYNQALGQGYYNKLLAEFGTPDRAAAAYNAGPGAVTAALTQAEKSGGSYLDYLPQETQAYVAKVMRSGAPDGLSGASTALAYNDNGNPISAGLAAINGALQPQSVNNSEATSGNPILDGLGAVGHAFESGLGSISQAVGAPSSGGSGFGISDNTRLGLLAAGLGIMGGNSQNPWQNIGQGGLAGIQAMQSGAKNQAEIGLERAQTQRHANR